MRRLPPEVKAALASLSQEHGRGSDGLDPRMVAKYIAGKLTSLEASSVEAAASKSLESSNDLLQSWREVEQFKLGERSRTGSLFAQEVLTEWLCEVRRFGRGASTKLTKELPLLGRNEDSAEIRKAVSQRQRQVVTVTGPQGVGKTALVREVVSVLSKDAELRVWWVECDQSETAEKLISKVCCEIDPTWAETNAQELIDGIADTSALLVVDGIGPDQSIRESLAQIASTCPSLQLVVTSRLPLDLESEQVYELNPLDLIAATELFLATARALTSDIDTDGVGKLCEHLGGLPAVIILAASKADLVSLDELRQVLPQDGSRSGGAHERLRNIQMKSLALLDDATSQAVVGLGAFHQEFSVTDAAYVCEVPEQEVSAHIGELCKRSLARMEIQRGLPLYQLSDRSTPVRADQNEFLGHCQRRHVQLFVERAKVIEKLFTTGQWSEAIKELNRHGGDIDAAVTHALAVQWDDMVVSFAKAIARTYFETGRAGELDRLANAALDIAATRDDHALQASMHGLLGAECSRSGDEASCTVHWLRRAELCAQVGDKLGMADAFCDLAGQAFDLGQYERALQLVSQAEDMARDVNSIDLIATAQIVGARTHLAQGDEIEARRWIDRTVETLRSAENRDLLLYVYQSLAIIYEEIGELELALQAAMTALDDAIDGDRGVHIALASAQVATVYESMGDVEQAALFLLQAARAHREMGSRHSRNAQKCLDAFVLKHGERASSAIEKCESVPWRALLREAGKR